VRALLAARLEDDQDALARLLAEDIALILPGEEPIIGRGSLLATWDRQAELLDEADAFETDVRALAGSDDHVFTYMETRAEAGGNPVTYTTMTAYRIRSGQITEVRYHVDDVLGYLGFWRSLVQGAGSGPAPAASSAPEPEPAPEPEVEPEPEPAPEPPRRKLGFARFR
jgi:ketosteroid isomerase-like protein